MSSILSSFAFSGPTQTDADLGGWITLPLPPSVDTGFRRPHTNVDPVTGTVNAGTAALG